MGIAKRTVKTSAPVVEKNHFINLYLGNVHLGYLTIDEHEDLVNECQNDPEYAQFIFGNEHISARYSQRGVSNEKKLVLPKRQ